MDMKSSSPKIIVSEWDGRPVWRYKTAEETLLEELYRKEKEKLQTNENKNETKI